MTSAEDTTRVTAMVAVLGSTGTGKSSFIRLVTGDDTVHVGHSLQSDTKQIVYTECFDDTNGQLTFMDTPGFDDSEGLSDVDILRMIGNDLYSEYGEGKLLNGVIYMYNIANTRVGGVNLRNIRMLEKLVGPNCLGNVVLVTTMWGTVNLADGERREAELRSSDQLFKLLIDAGAQMIRHDSGHQSARRIIEAILGNEPKSLLVQTELSSGVPLGKTSAGQELVLALDRADNLDARGLKSLEEELQEAKDAGDTALGDVVQKEMAKLRCRMQSRAEDRTKLEQDYHSFGVRMGARIGVRATGMKHVGAVTGGVIAFGALAMLKTCTLVEKACRIPKEKRFAAHMPEHVAKVENISLRYASAGRKAFVCAAKALGNLAEEIGRYRILTPAPCGMSLEELLLLERQKKSESPQLQPIMQEIRALAYINRFINIRPKIIMLPAAFRVFCASVATPSDHSERLRMARAPSTALWPRPLKNRFINSGLQTGLQTRIIYRAQQEIPVVYSALILKPEDHETGEFESAQELAGALLSSSARRRGAQKSLQLRTPPGNREFVRIHPGGYQGMWGGVAPAPGGFSSPLVTIAVSFSSGEQGDAGFSFARLIHTRNIEERSLRTKPSTVRNALKSDVTCADPENLKTKEWRAISRLTCLPRDLKLISSSIGPDFASTYPSVSSCHRLATP
ncbi:hypothetical protein C8R45DRAFT_1174774 [Mycena sanguinolenta]|nr:hypothetical protein C8R45DRAFT_1174774 [Mycena sanguinolenta]